MGFGLEERISMEKNKKKKKTSPEYSVIKKIIRDRRRKYPKQPNQVPTIAASAAPSEIEEPRDILGKIDILIGEIRANSR